MNLYKIKHKSFFVKKYKKKKNWKQTNKKNNKN
jgi:hypothetical protein